MGIKTIINDLGVILEESNTTITTIEVNTVFTDTVDFSRVKNIIGLFGATGAAGAAGATGATGEAWGINDLTFSGTVIVSINIGPTNAAGSNQSNATQLPTGKFAYVCRSDGTNKGIILTIAHVVLGLNFIIINDDYLNTNFRLYPPIGGKLNDASINSQITISAGKTYMLTCFDVTPGASRWSVIGL